MVKAGQREGRVRHKDRMGANRLTKGYRRRGKPICISRFPRLSLHPQSPTLDLGLGAFRR